VQHVTLEGSLFADRGDYQVYLPPCYDVETARRYPVLYLPHGAGHDDEYWLSVGVDAAADIAIAAGQVQPMIFVMPDGGPGFVAPDTRATFEDYLSRDLVPDVDARFRTDAARARRAIGGISLGGGKALAAAAQLPQLFSSVGGHSAAVGNVPDLAPGLARADVRIYLDVGDRDPLRSGTRS